VGHQPGHALEQLQDGRHLLAGEDHWQPLRTLRPHDPVQPGEVQLQHRAVEEQQGALSAWFWVEAATFPSTASELKKRVISGAPISAGWRLRWNRM